MHRTLSAFLFLSLLWAAQALHAESPYKKKVMANGLEIYVIENHGVPLMTIDITTRNGSFTEPESFAGLSHLYEHMFYKANSVYPSQEKYMERLRELGISFNGYTTEEFVSYFFTMPAKNLKDGMAFMSAAITSPLFDKTELEKEREVVLGEFDRNEADPLFRLYYALDSATWGKNVVRKQPLGQRNTIKAATQEQMRDIQNKFYIPNNSALIVSGDVNADEVFALAESMLSAWKRGDAPFPKYNPPPFEPMRTELIQRDAQIPYVYVEERHWGPSIGVDDKGVVSADIYTTLVNLETSRLHRLLVDSGLVTSFSVGYQPQHNVGPLVLTLNAPPEKVKQAIAIAHDELRRSAESGYFSDEDVKTAKQIVRTNRLYETENPMSFGMGTTAFWWGVANVEFYENYLSRTESITREDLSSFAKTYALSPAAIGVGAPQPVLHQLALNPMEVVK